MGLVLDSFKMIGALLDLRFAKLSNSSLNVHDNLNFTFIVLIPKVTNPLSVHEYRPINLCNVLYKIITKVLANKLKRVLLVIISNTQSAFIYDRLITNNIMVTYEVLHTMKTRQKEVIGSMTLKLNMSKAYDRIEWFFF